MENNNEIRDGISLAKSIARNTKTADELRRSLAVSLTLEYKLTLSQVAEVVGRSASWVAQARKHFILSGKTKNSSNHGGRRNQIMPIEEENAFMADVYKTYLKNHRAYWNGEPGVEYSDMSINNIARKKLIEIRNRPIAKSTVSNFINRVAEREFKKLGVRSWHEYYAKYLKS